jgi:hypothetical protein
MPVDLRFRPLPPNGFPDKRTPDYARKGRPFQQGIDDTMAKLRYELNKLAATEAFLAVATDDVLKDGSRPHVNARIFDPGVVVTAFTPKGVMTWACDACQEWPDNARAIALTIERLRMADIYGVTKDRQYRGFAALPARTGLNGKDEALRVIADALGITLEEVKRSDDLLSLVRRAQKVTHPDRGGDREAYERVERARAILEMAG